MSSIFLEASLTLALYKIIFQALYELFDLDRDGVLSLAEFEKVLRALGRACKNEFIIVEAKDTSKGAK